MSLRKRRCVHEASSWAGPTVGRRVHMNLSQILPNCPPEAVLTPTSMDNVEISLTQNDQAFSPFA